MKKILPYIAAAIWIFIILYFISEYYYNKGKEDSKIEFIKDTIDYQKPRLDSLVNVRDSIVIKVNYIDSITYEKIKETIDLSDSASVALFIELVSK